MARRARDIVSEQFREAVRQVFEEHSERATTVEPIQPDHANKLFQGLGEEREMLSSIIRLEGKAISTCLAMMANRDTVEALASSKTNQPRDYIGELSNVVMGGLKNSLSAYGVNPQLGLPVSVQGLRLELILQLKEQEAVVALLNAGPVVAILQYSVDDDLWNKIEAGAPAAEPGSICFF